VGTEAAWVTAESNSGRLQVPGCGVFWWKTELSDRVAVLGGLRKVRLEFRQQLSPTLHPARGTCLTGGAQPKDEALPVLLAVLELHLVPRPWVPLPGLY
jgi:hypothetical protein